MKLYFAKYKLKKQNKFFATISSQQKEGPDDITEHNISLNCYWF